MHHTWFVNLSSALLLFAGSGCGNKQPKIVMPTGPVPPPPAVGVVGGGGAPAEKEALKDAVELLGQPAPDATDPPR